MHDAAIFSARAGAATVPARRGRQCQRVGRLRAATDARAPQRRIPSRHVVSTVHGLEVLLFLVALGAWLPRADVGLSLLMALLGTTQIALADAQGRTGGLHPLGALLVLVLAAAIVRRDLQRRRQQRLPHV
jgi:hypothetical protein